MANDTVQNEVREAIDDANLDEEYEYEEESRGPSGISLALNRYFHHLDRGGTLGGEILAGISMFFVAICVIFMNMQLVASAIDLNTELINAPGVQTNIDAAHLYTDLYVGSILVAIIGTLLMGLVAKLPFTQISLMCLVNGLLNRQIIESGLTWQNLLLLNLIAGVIYVVICVIPAVRRWICTGIPDPVRKVLPAAMGLMIAWYALQQTGLFAISSETGAVTGLALENMRGSTFWGLICAAVTAALFLLLTVLKRKHKVFWSMIGGTVIFALAMLLLNGTDTSNTESLINFGRVWLVAGSQASPITPFADSYLTYALDSIAAVFENLGQVFTAGTDFSAYSGNTAVTVIGGVLLYVLTALLGTQAALSAAQEDISATTEDKAAVNPGSAAKVLVCNAATNVIAPFFGVAGIGCGITSVSAIKDGAKSGLASVVACFGFVISLFVMAFPALFATETYPVISMNQWNYFAYGNGGIVYLMDGVKFAIVDAVLVCVGISMTSSLKALNWKAAVEWVSGILCVLTAVLTGNLVLGTLAGTAFWLVLSLITDRKAVCISTIVLAMLMALAILFV